MDWEYKVLTHAWINDLEKTLNLLGEQGWEAVSCSYEGSFGKVILKRPIPVAEVESVDLKDVPNEPKEGPMPPIWGNATEWVEFKKPECPGCKEKQTAMQEAVNQIKSMRDKLVEQGKKYESAAQEQFDSFKKAVYEGGLGQALKKMWHKPEQK